MRKFNLILQEILKFVLLFLLCFVWTRYSFKKLWLSLLLALIFTTIIYTFLWYLGQRKSNRQGLKLKEKADAEDMYISLVCQNKPIDFFAEILSKRYEKIEKHLDFVIYQQNKYGENQNLEKIQTKHAEKSEKTALFFDSSFDGLTVSNLLKIHNKLKKEKADRIIILCKEITDKQVFAICQNFKEKFVILNQYQTYQKIYKANNIYPQITIKYKNEKKMVFKDFVYYSFNKNRTKGYLFSAFVLILSSLFVKATIYYCIIASILVIFALVSQFNPYFNKKTDFEGLWKHLNKVETNKY